jgi:hypothetical protein
LIASGVIEQEIQTSELVNRVSEQLGDPGLVGHVGWHRLRAFASERLGCDLLERIRASARQNHQPARLQQREGNGSSDAAAGSGNNRSSGGWR